MKLKDIQLPTFIDHEAWAGFCEMRAAKGKRAPFTQRAAKLILKTLQTLKDNGHDPNASLDQSTQNGWSDVYEPKQKTITKVSVREAEKTQAYLAEYQPVEVTPEQKAEVSERLKAVRQAIQLRRVA